MLVRFKIRFVIFSSTTSVSGCVSPKYCISTVLRKYEEMEINISRYNSRNRKCAISNCENAKHNINVRYFSFPETETRIKNWLELINNSALSSLSYNKIRYVHIIKPK